MRPRYREKRHNGPVHLSTNAGESSLTSLVAQFEALRKDLESARQAEQDAFNAQREIGALLASSQEKYDLQLQQAELEWTGTTHTPSMRTLFL